MKSWRQPSGSSQAIFLTYNGVDIEGEWSDFVAWVESKLRHWGVKLWVATSKHAKVEGSQ